MLNKLDNILKMGQRVCVASGAVVGNTDMADAYRYISQLDFDFEFLKASLALKTLTLTLGRQWWNIKNPSSTVTSCCQPLQPDFQ